jgi:hypothetical protein
MESTGSTHHNGAVNGSMNGRHIPPKPQAHFQPRNGTANALSTTSSAPPPSRDSDITSPSSVLSSPPYWTQSHTRSFSNISIESVAPGAITLRDNTNATDDRNEACWAKGATIDDYVVVKGMGGGLGIGAFVVWNIKVETLRVSASQTSCFRRWRKFFERCMC